MHRALCAVLGSHGIGNWMQQIKITKRLNFSFDYSRKKKKKKTSINKKKRRWRYVVWRRTCTLVGIFNKKDFVSERTRTIVDLIRSGRSVAAITAASAAAATAVHIVAFITAPKRRAAMCRAAVQLIELYLDNVFSHRRGIIIPLYQRRMNTMREWIRSLAALWHRLRGWRREREKGGELSNWVTIGFLPSNPLLLLFLV